MQITETSLKCRSGKFEVHHVGPRSYWVVRNHKLLASFSNMSEAAAYARRENAIEKMEVNFADPATLHNALKREIGQ